MANTRSRDTATRLLRALVVAALAPIAAARCRTPTEFRVVVRSDLPCPAAPAHARVKLYVAPTLDALATAASRGEAQTCGGATDDVVLVPDGDATSFAVRVAARLDGADPDGCTAAAPTPECVVQEVQLSFRAHDAQTFSATLSPSCAGVACSPGTTCVAPGTCVPDAIAGDCRGAGCTLSGREPDASTDADGGAPTPASVRLVNGTTGGSHLDVCVKRPDGSWTLLLQDRGLAPLFDDEISAPLPLPDDAASTVTFALWVDGSGTCADVGPARVVSLERHPGARYLLFRTSAFDAAAIPDVLPSSPSSGEVTIRLMNDAIGSSTHSFSGAKLSLATTAHDGTTSTQPALTAIPLGALGSGASVPLDVASLTASADDTSFPTRTLPLSPGQLVAGRSYTAFVFDDDAVTTRVFLCDDLLGSATGRGVCFRAP